MTDRALADDVQRIAEPAKPPSPPGIVPPPSAFVLRLLDEGGNLALPIPPRNGAAEKVAADIRPGARSALPDAAPDLAAQAAAGTASSHDPLLLPAEHSVPHPDQETALAAPLAPITPGPAAAAHLRHAPGHALPASVISDIALTFSQKPDGPVELNLWPRELGRLRMTFSHSGDTVQVLVQVERADTLDLLRRNADSLLRELGDAGFAGGNLTFQDWGGNQSESSSSPPVPVLAILAEPGGPEPVHLARAGLDLRL
jgi:hypothetical protein